MSLLGGAKPLPGQLERLQELVKAEAGQLSPESISLLEQHRARSA